ncbi:MAG: sulfite exporter TauE/SafE family protein [Leucothrix sp.]
MLYDPYFYFLATIATLIVGISKGGFGGGLAIVAVPIMSLAIDPILAAAIILPILCVMDLISVKAYWKQWDAALVKSIIPAAALGILLGGLSFHYFNAGAIRLLLGLLAVTFTLNYWLKKTIVKKQAHTYWGWFWSALTGFTSFVAHAGGPPINAYLLPLRLNKSVFQGTCVLVFTIINYLKLIPYFLLGQLNDDNLYTSLALLPLAFIGVFIGIKLHKRISEVLFYQLSYLFLFMTGLKLLWDGIVSFI